MAVNANAYGMFSKVQYLNYVYLTQNSDAPVPDAKPGTYIQRLHSRLSSFMPTRLAPAAPMTSGAILMGSSESAALFPCKRARETVLALQAAESKKADHTMYLG